MDMVKSARMKYLQKELGPESSLDDIDDQLESLLGRAALDGTVDKLEATEHYRELMSRRQEASRRKYETSTPEERYNFATLAIFAKDEKINERIAVEKEFNGVAVAAGVAAGVFVGSGKMMELLKSGASSFNLKWPNLGIKGWFSHEDAAPAVARPNLENLQPAGPTIPSAPEIAGAGMVAGETTLEVGNRGIEGALLDHLKTPEGAKMMEWLQAQDYNKGVTDKGALVHRFVSDYAKEHGFNIDQGGGNDLSKIFGAEVHVGGDGAINIGEEKFMPGASVVDHTDVSPEAPHEPTTDIQHNDHINSPEAPLDHTAPPAPEEGLGAGPETAVTSADSASVSAEVEPSAVSKPNLLQEGRFEAALSQEKTSTALRLLLDKDYSGFMRDMHLGDGALDKISKMSHAEFLQEFNDSDSFRDTYRELASVVKYNYAPSMEKLKMKDILVTIIKVRQEKGLI